jgi:hypothetical protein
MFEGPDGFGQSDHVGRIAGFEVWATVFETMGCGKMVGAN